MVMPAKPRYPRRQMYGLLLIALGIILFASAFFVRLRRLALVSTVMVGAGAVMVLRKV